MSLAPNFPPSDQEPALYAVIDGKPVLLDGHLERGVMAVIHDIALEKGMNVAELPRPIELFRGEQEVVLH